MERVIQDDRITHVYTEYEWEQKFPLDKTETLDSLDLYKAEGVKECTEEGKRWFNVLTKPDDILLSDSKPKNVISMDTWKYRANEMYLNLVRKDTNVFGINAWVPMLGCVVALTDRAVRTPDGKVFLHIPGYGMVGFVIPADYAPMFSYLKEVPEQGGEIFDPEQSPYYMEFFGTFAMLELLKRTLP